MFATLVILKGAVQPNRKYPIPVAVLLDLIVAACLACLSLWLGLLGTSLEIGPAGLLNVLAGRDPTGAAAQIGPLFWSMHTVFLPTAGYLLLIVAFWLGRLLVLSALGVLNRGKEVENPHHHTAMLLALIAVIFSVAAGVGGSDPRNALPFPPSGS